MMNQGRVTGLWIYPVKSCRGISLKEMTIGLTGPLHDHEWMIVDSDNQFQTLRTHSKLAEIKTSLQGPFLHLYLGGSNKILIDTTEESAQIETVTVWKDSFLAGVSSKDINEALSDFLSKTVKLVRYQKQSFRDLKTASTEAVKQTMFADSRPILLTNENSLVDLNTRLIEKSVMERFRSNIIIDGLPAFSEDQIEKVKIGEVNFENPKLCVRCPVITQDVETGKVVSKETLKTLSDLRRSSDPTNKVTFGLNLTPSQMGVVRLGDLVSII